MKHKGQSYVSKPRDRAVIPRPSGGDIVIWIKAVPLGFEEEAEETFPTPKPPTRFARDAKGRLVKDPETGRVITEPDETPEFREILKTVQRRQMMLMLTRAVDDPDWEFETPKPADGADKVQLAAYYDAIFEELRAAGFTVGDLAILIQKVMSVSNMSKEALETARDALVEGKH